MRRTPETARPIPESSRVDENGVGGSGGAEHGVPLLFARPRPLQIRSRAFDLVTAPTPAPAHTGRHFEPFSTSSAALLSGLWKFTAQKKTTRKMRLTMSTASKFSS